MGDRIRFLHLPDEWQRPGYWVHRESIAFLRVLIRRRRPCRVARIESDGYPWIYARVRRMDGRREHHGWGIYERTGWKRVGEPRARRLRAPAAGRGPRARRGP